MELAGRFEGNLHCLPVRVYFEDTDFTGVVYHARYLHFMERGRTDYLRLKGISHSELGKGSFGKPGHFVVSSMALKFKTSASIDDLLMVETTIKEMRGARIIMRQTILRDETVVAYADVEVVLVDKDQRPLRLPSKLIEAL